jgi:predicted phage terminase large subunit-like protein
METKRLLKNLENPWKYLPHTLASRLSFGKWVPYNYLKMISHKITEAIAKGNGRIIVCLPPRHGKSELISHWIPVWFLNNWPDQSIILSSYEADFAAGWGRKVRNTINLNHDKLNFQLAADSASASRWNTKQGGGMVTAGAGGPITGRGGNLIIVDDPIKNWMDAQSETLRLRLIEWFFSTLYTRAEPNATIIIIQTRWHEQDLVGEIIANHAEDWCNIKLPALAENTDPLNRSLGEALCPDRYNESALIQIKKTIGTSMFEALYQQNPAPPEGHIFKRDWWKYYDVDNPPPFLGIIQSWDCAYEIGMKNSFSVGQTWGVTENGFYLIHQFRDKLEYPDLIRAVQKLAEKYNPEKIFIEYQAAGRSLVQDLLRKTRLPIRAAKTQRNSKETRALMVTALIESGKVYLPERVPWLEVFLHELTMFPAGKHNDQVDALSQALGLLKNVSFRRRKRRGKIERHVSAAGDPDQGAHARRRRRRKSKLYFGSQFNIRARWLAPK